MIDNFQNGIDPYLQRVKVLYVEDEDVIRDSIARFLKRRIKNLLLASNGREGLEIYKNENPDIVVTDIMMPQMNGIDMSAAIKSINDDTPIIITSAFNDEDYFLKSIDIGVIKYIKKPVNNNDLLNALVKVARAVSQQKEIEAKNEFIRTILDNNPTFIMITDIEEIYFLNSSFLNFLGFETFDEFLEKGKNVNRFMVVKEDSFYKGKSFNVWIKEAIAGEKTDCIVHMAGKDQLKSEARAYIIHANAIPELQTRKRYLVTFTDISHIECDRKMFQDLATKDALTNIFNRKKFEDELKKEIERSLRYNNYLSLIIFDIDHFKSVNDTYGHPTGDYVLKEITKLVTENIRKYDIFARYGGEEFVILTPETNLAGAKDLAEKIREIIQDSVFKEVGKVTCSFGVSEYVKQEDPAGFIKKADYALYIAKNKGRNRVKAVEKEHSFFFNLPY
ncbi:GGDEF domain-containing response regulator [Candidatus Magnetominusculus xianensis]|uniref:diguanylate cyclase n=1 Tax=Candidatus Magnetominusculus xianensis TaxID=1748249 RepID=A0ABR5SCX8_9BACT|nr:diguanylate cyclase [Candidatus Magnetominusculus xianensis]KWT82511.1 diguanylate cyclase response regulator [Candidatus Magnetominusculus xianensis]MBF0405409.1 diguanylate cyclase [Nitrospirota bacterium]